MTRLVPIRECPSTDLQDDAAVAVRERFGELPAADVGGGAETAVGRGRVRV